MKHALVRDHIIKTASDLFYRNGYNRTGINEIINEAGIAKATLYNHFKSKEAICVAYLKYMNDQFLKDFKGYLDSKPSGESKLLGIFDYLQTFYASKSFNGCWCINTISEIPKENTLVRNEIVSQKKALIDYITELVDANLTSDTLNENLAKQIYLLYEGAVSESHLQQDSWPISSAKDICKTLI